MLRFNKRGNRIRASDKSLVFRFSAGSLLLLFLTVVMLLNLKTIITTDWKVISLFQNSSVHLTVTPYRIMTIVLATLVCVLATLFYRRFQYDRVKQLFHRQKLARMLLENGWYESESTQDSGFFKDLPATTKKEKITYFPKLYYRMEHGLLYIRTEITLGKYQEQLLHLEKKLETGLYCELVSKELKDSYVEYVLLYDTIANRITINEVQAEHGSLRLMKNVWWEYDKLPHMLTSLVSTYSISAIAAYGITGKLETILFYPAMAFNMVLTSIVGQCIGAKRVDRAKDYLKLSLKYGITVLFILSILIIIFSKQLAGLFVSSDPVAQIVEEYFIIISIGYVLNTVTNCYLGCLNGMGKPTKSMILMIFYYLVVRIPLAYVFSYIGLGLNGIWIAVLISHIIACITAILTGTHSFKKNIKMEG